MCIVNLFPIVLFLCITQGFLPGNLHYDVWGATCTQGKRREDLADYEDFQKWVEKKKEIRNEERRKEWDERRAVSIKSLVFTSHF